MILFHGSNVKVTDIDLSKCRPYKDFGQGFYMTDILEQASQMANRVTKLYGGKPCVSAFHFDNNLVFQSEFKTLNFEKPNKDWAIFVLNNRDRKFQNFKAVLCNHDNKYDIVTGPVANDDIAYLFRTFSNGLIDIDTLIRNLEYKKLTMQYSFHTEKILKNLFPTEELSYE